MSEHFPKQKRSGGLASKKRIPRKMQRQPHDEGETQGNTAMHTTLLHLQHTIGNAAVQRLINNPSNSKIQRFTGGLWDTIGKAWDTITGSQPDEPAQTTNQDAEQSAPAGAAKLAVPPGQWTITDKKAYVRSAPPALTPDKGQPVIPKGTSVKITDAVYQGGKYYVQVEDYLADGAFGPVRNFGWTSAGNAAGLPDALVSANPDQQANETSEEEVTIPKPSQKGILGLPAMPDLQDQAEFASIVQELAAMEQNPVGVESKHGEETGDKRQERVEKIAEVRKLIANLPAKLPMLDAGKIKEAQAYLYRRLAPLAPYYNQMGNTNMLGKSSKGWDRTCNVTVPAMVIEGLGKTKDDYDQDKIPLLKRVFAALEGKYKVRKIYEAVSEFDELRLPDFMALVGIARQLPDNADSLSETDFVEAVSKARSKAARVTTAHSTMMYLLEAFGAKHQQSGVYHDKLDTIGGARKKYIKEQLRGKSTAAHQESYDSVKADELLSVKDYRAAVLKKVNPMLDNGSQILVGMENHFVRLDALGEDGIQVDDPGEKGFKNLRVTWEQARDLGYFKGFWEVTG